MTLHSPFTATGSRALDGVLFAGILTLMVFSVPRLLAYDRSPLARISVIAVAPNGERILMKTPTPLEGVRPGIQDAERRIRAFAATPAASQLVPPGGKLEWSVHYAKSIYDPVASTRLSGVRIIAVENPR